MSSEETKLAVVGLTRPEALDLERALRATTNPNLEEHDVDNPSAGVLVETIVVLTLGGMAISGLTGWLLKNRTGTKIKQTVEVRHPDGRVETRVLEVEHTESITGEYVDDVVKSLRQPVAK
ncbi:MAG: hypothetical protein QOI30_2404 [Mycobacterium sp.]|jgi:hypothetical protein|uniref:hypothetical protein n=1 Tax=Mycobacterium sp. TaxID=1785 RepID=UPI0028B6C2D3|nr:hypothetical protein [Mycobacterium sp.]MDT7769394.1 hypothetical protein [Mycobacterium sp.]MEA2590873.1 hypothetical protein [Actinomycetota bacterium]